ncbi:hypothetical protein SNEBB_002503 [Seison nebaliae]|nr:hypothetical protein SNEBB_002503 [Seison nebaliae]
MYEKMKIEQFHIIKTISHGAYGTVLLGCKKSDEKKKYAIKMLNKKEMRKKNIRPASERDILARSHSPFIVDLFYSFQSFNDIFLVMDFMIGGDMKSLLLYCGHFPMDWMRFYIAEISCAINYLHEKHSIIHRDIKPDNILIDRKGHIKLTDFGLSSSIDQRNNSKNKLIDIIGTPSHLNEKTPNQIFSLLSNLSINDTSLNESREESFINESFTNDRSPTIDRRKKRKRSIKSMNRSISKCQYHYNEASFLTDTINNDQSIDLSIIDDQSISLIHSTSIISKDSIIDDGLIIDDLHINQQKSSTPTKELKRSNSTLVFTPKVINTKNIRNCPLTEAIKTIKKSQKTNEVSAPILGTPEYMSPELLLGSDMDKACDWWSLGVCMYEFIFGITPFYDESVQMIFQNILYADVNLFDNKDEDEENQYPLEDDVKLVLLNLLQKDIGKRADFSFILTASFFNTINFTQIIELTPPFIPQPQDEDDIGYFHFRNEFRKTHLKNQ